MSIRLKHLSATAIVATLSLAFSSCGAIYDDQGDCDVYYHVRFVFDHNLSYADAFAHEVESVSLYVFDADGRFVTQTTDRGDALAADGYTLPLPALEAGRYTLVAWCGLEGDNDSYNDSYEVPQLEAGRSTLTDLTCTLDGRTRGDDGRAHVQEIDRLYHGLQTFDLLADEGTHTLTLPLVKNTKDIRIVLQHMSGQEVNVDDFLFTITDDNGRMAHDNTLLDDELLVYEPWYTSQGTASLPDDNDPDAQMRATTSVSVAVAELTVNRLMAGQTANPTTLTITRAQPEADGTHRTVLSIPLVDYALLVKGHYNEQMSDQEYLDRQDEYNLTFFLDEDNNWLNTSIIINSWRVVLSEVEL